MDNILAKHLANALLFPHQDNIESTDDNNISFSSYKILDDKYYVKIDNEVVSSKLKGYWNNMPVIIYNKQRYALLENSKSLVNLKFLGVRDIQPILIKEEVVDEPVYIQGISETTPNNTAQYLNKPTLIPKEDTESTTSQSNDDFFSRLEKYKDDPRVKQLFNYHADLAKKEIFKITEKFTQQQMARAMESGGGANAVQYANGGIMKGNLVIDGNLSVTGKMNEGFAANDVAAKKVFIIGDNASREYTITHNLNTKDIIISIYNTLDEQVVAGVKNISLNETKLSFSNPIPQDSIKVVIIG